MKRVIEEMISKNVNDSGSFKVVLAGLSNVYTHYITTFEEYQMQRYEAGSTIYGPNTLQAYLEQYAYLTENLFLVSIYIYFDLIWFIFLSIILLFNKDEKLDSGTAPPDLMAVQSSLNSILSVFTAGNDRSGMYLNFGDCTLQPPRMVVKGDMVKVR
jgi:neutral ceramidase